MEMYNNLTEEEKKELRRKQIAMLKASNQLLEESKEKVIAHEGIPESEKKKRIEQIDNAKKENYERGASYLHSTVSEIENATYDDATDEYKKKYQERLKKRGITDEQMRRKSDVVVETDTEENDTRRKRMTKKEISEEQKLMKKTMATDKKIKEHIKKNEALEQRELAFHIDMNKKSENIDEVKEKPNDIEIEHNVVEYKFDFSSIPDYVQYDIIPLPSKGQCYPKSSPLRCGRIPVAYLTASDENIISSPNMYRDGKIIDVILGRKILDKSINPNDLCRGDRDAIVLWLRATGYGNEFPIVVNNPNDNEKKYNTTVDLSKLDYLDFKLKGDDDGLFEYTLKNGDVIKYRLLTNYDQQVLKDNTTLRYVNSEKYEVIKSLNKIKSIIDGITTIDDTTRGYINEDIDEIMSWADDTDVKNEEENLYSAVITEQMILMTVSVNGNADRNYIRKYVENMRTIDSYGYRNYVSENIPGVDFNITVKIPESDGGGSVKSFLRIDNAIFLNV